jgi:hypothetical protein
VDGDPVYGEHFACLFSKSVAFACLLTHLYWRFSPFIYDYRLFPAFAPLQETSLVPLSVPTPKWGLRKSEVAKSDSESVFFLNVFSHLAWANTIDCTSVQPLFAAMKVVFCCSFFFAHWALPPFGAKEYPMTANQKTIAHIRLHVLQGVQSVAQFSAAFDDLWVIDVTNGHLSDAALATLRAIAVEVSVEPRSRVTRLWVTL